MSQKPARRCLQLAMAEPWAITPEALQTILTIAARLNESPDAIAERVGKRLENTHAVSVRDGVATIPVTGPLFRRADFFTEISGATSYEQIATDFTAALENADIKAIVFDIDSPGGEVNGISELAAMIYAGRGQKPILAYISGYGASAAYWLASAADEVVVSDTAIAGSIGVIATFVDTSVAEEDAGIRVINVVSSQSPYKTADPSVPDDRARIQKTVDDLAAVFVSAVAKYRGVSEKTVLAKFGRGDVMVGQAAVAAGLVDRLGRYENEHTSIAPADAGNGLRKMAAIAAWKVPIAAGAISLPDSLLQVSRVLRIRSAPPLLSPPAPAGDPPAPVATSKEDVPMDPKPAAPAGAPDDTALQAETERVDTIMALAAEHSIPLPKVHAWIKAKATVEVVSREINAGYKERLGAIPQPTAEDLAKAAGTGVTRIEDQEPKKPFRSVGEQAMAVRASVLQKRTDPRLLHLNDSFKAATGLSEGVDSDGGFLLQPTFADEFRRIMWTNGEILSRVNRRPIGPNSNSLKINGIDEVSRANGSRWGGILGYWVDEAVAPTPTKPKFGQIDLKLKKVAAVVYTTEEEREDVVALDALLNEIVPLELAFRVEDAIINGTGAGMPMGLLTSPSLVTQAIEATQTIANSPGFIAINAAKMFSQMYPAGMKNAVWLMNQLMYPTLYTATLGASGGATPVFLPGGNLEGAPFGALLGRPIIPVEQCSAEGTPGDLILADLSQYQVIDKGGVNQQVSIHVKFLEGEHAFRFTYRIDGQPRWRSSITPFKAGAQKVSPFIVLNTRS